MDNEPFIQWLEKQSDDFLKNRKAAQYTSKREMAEDIAINDDGSVREEYEMSGSFLEMLAKKL